MYPDVEKWQARRESNPQPAVLETAALPIELLAFCSCVSVLLNSTVTKFPAPLYQWKRYRASSEKFWIEAKVFFE